MGAPLAAYSGCGEGDGGIGHSKRRSRTGLARVCGDVQFAGTFSWPDVGSVAGWRSGWEWNGAQSGQGAAELGFPRPALGQMQSEAARRAGEPSRQSEEPSPEGLGGGYPLSQTDAGGPTGQVMRQHLDRQPGPLRQAQDWRRSGPRGDGSARRRT